MSRLRTFFRQERNKNLYLLIAILVHNLLYPLSIAPGVQPVVFYIVFSFMFVIAVFLLTQQRLSRIIVTAAGVGTFVSGVTNSYQPDTMALALLYLSAAVYIFTMLAVLGYYIFGAKRVLIEVVIAATCLYLVIGLLYVPIFGLIELLDPSSFIASSGAQIAWQRLLYFSYVTLTTLGYGDITPVKFYAQSFATFEAITGVLYTVILLSRLVSLYVMEQSNDMERDVIPPL